MRPLNIRLMIILMMFPQIAETIYSPALIDISTAMQVSAAQAGDTISYYFIFFALGVVFWGYLCDKIGRRPTMLIGLTIYSISAIIAFFSSNFALLLWARCLSAFGAAVGSVVTQTMMRDRYQSQQLVKIFTIIGFAISISPVIGLLLGGFLTENFGYRAVFAVLCLLSTWLLCWSGITLPETRTHQANLVSLQSLFKQMLHDKILLSYAGLIAAYNIMVFSYYQLAPFVFDTLHLSKQIYGFSGLVLTLASLLGVICNRYFSLRYRAFSLMVVTVILTVISSILLLALQNSVAFLLPIFFIVICYNIMIPHLLAMALHNYQHCLGRAGAVLGLIYYLLLGAGLMLSAWLQSLSWIICIASLLALILIICLNKADTESA